jgi:hypothetical protein
MGTYNGGAFSDPEIDKMIIASSSIIDRAEREKALQAINKKSVDDVFWIPLHYQQDIYAVVKVRGSSSPRVRISGLWPRKSSSVYPQTASFGPGRRSRCVKILDVALLRLRFHPRCGLDLDQNLSVLNGH